MPPRPAKIDKLYKNIIKFEVKKKNYQRVKEYLLEDPFASVYRLVFQKLHEVSYAMYLVLHCKYNNTIGFQQIFYLMAFK